MTFGFATVNLYILPLQQHLVPVKPLLAMSGIGMEFLTGLFKKLMQGELMPEDWRKSVLVPLYTGKGVIKECGN